jgi:hypothetical protein
MRCKVVFSLSRRWRRSAFEIRVCTQVGVLWRRWTPHEALPKNLPREVQTYLPESGEEFGRMMGVQTRT